MYAEMSASCCRCRNIHTTNDCGWCNRGKPIKSRGPGTELKAIIPGYFQHKGCGCMSYAMMMDQWGTDLCEQRKDLIVLHLMKQAKQLTLMRIIPEVIQRHQAINWVDEAIRRSRSG